MHTVSIPMEQLVQILELQLENGTAPLTVTGSSMHPMLRSHRDMVYLQAVQNPLKQGELILYRRDDDQYVLHRIISVRPDGSFVCSGDNQYVPEKVLPHQVLAVVSGFCRAGKTYTVEQLGYRCYVRVWVWMFPVRRPVLAARRLLGCIRRRFRKP